MSHRRVERLFLGASFIIAGTLHFVRPWAYEKIVPSYLPAPGALVLISGAAEIAGGMGVLVPRLQRVSGWGLLALLVAVFPANLHMALHPEEVPELQIPRALLWFRLPLQPLMIAWVWRVLLRR